MGQGMPTGLYTRWEFDTDMQKFKARQSIFQFYENDYFFSIRKQDQKSKLRAFSHLKNRRKLTDLKWKVFVITVKQCSKQWDVFTSSVLVNKLVPVKRSGY